MKLISGELLGTDLSVISCTIYFKHHASSIVRFFSLGLSVRIRAVLLRFFVVGRHERLILRGWMLVLFLFTVRRLDVLALVVAVAPPGLMSNRHLK
jgi:hypothetical protein